MSKGSSRPPLTVVWNSTLRLWTKKPEQEGFFELLEPYSETWPPSGSMRSGSAWQRRRSALPTPASASSSSPGRLLSTPVASDGGTDRGSSAGRGLRDETRKLLPTPRTSDTNGAGEHGDGGVDLRTAVAMLPTPRATRGGSTTETMYELGAERTDRDRPQGEVLLPTPRARDGKGAGYEDDLPSRVTLLPTPTASNPNDGESLESWEGRRQRNLAKGINGNGQGTPLAIAVKLLPTPMAGDAKGTRSATANCSTDNPDVNLGWTLTDVVYSGALSNPPAPPAHAPSGPTTAEGSAPGPAAATAPTPTSDGPADASTRTVPAAPAKLLPTPRVSDTGTPGRRASEGFRPPLSQVIIPLSEGKLLPTPTRSDGERSSSSYGRGNPTLTGALTDQPSAGGKPSSDDLPLGQQTLWAG